MLFYHHNVNTFFCSLFSAEGIAGRHISHMADKELQDIGILRKGDRIDILNAVQSYNPSVSFDKYIIFILQFVCQVGGSYGLSFLVTILTLSTCSQHANSGVNFDMNKSLPDLTGDLFGGLDMPAFDVSGIVLSVFNWISDVAKFPKSCSLTDEFRVPRAVTVVSCLNS